jgi:hypothetical protein
VDLLALDIGKNNSNKFKTNTDITSDMCRFKFYITMIQISGIRYCQFHSYKYNDYTVVTINPFNYFFRKSIVIYFDGVIRNKN